MVPEPLREGVAGLFAHWHETLTEIDGMAALIRDLKYHGYRCYLLSNTSLRVETYWQDFEVLRLLEGRFISARARLMKPDPAIYKAMCGAFGLKAEESVFIDDRPENIRGAEQAGMRGIHFPTYDVGALRENLKKEGVLV
jgi:putative hydrolase of the HAD superfamily